MQFSGAVSDDVDCTPLAHDTDQWSALMKTAMNLPVSYKAKRFPIKQASISLPKTTPYLGVKRPQM
jgi:hypothetical protein